MALLRLGRWRDGRLQKALGDDPRGEQGPQGQRRRAAVQRHLQQVADRRPRGRRARHVHRAERQPVLAGRRGRAGRPQRRRSAGKLDGFNQVAVDGSKVDGKLYMVPESLKAVALWYDKSKITTAPATTDDAARRVKDGIDQARPEPERVPLVRVLGRLRRHPHGRHRQVRRRPGRLRRRVQVLPGPQGRRRQVLHRRQRPQAGLPDRQAPTPSSTARGRRPTSPRPSATTSPSRRSPPPPARPTPSPAPTAGTSTPTPPTSTSPSRSPSRWSAPRASRS